MSDIIKMNFNDQPSFLVSYIQGLFWRRHGIKDGNGFPKYFIEWDDVMINRRHLDKYCALCSIEKNDDVPILYPLTKVFANVMRIISHKKFPFAYPKMLQLRNHIIYHQPIKITDKLNISSEVIEERYVKKGIELNVKSIIAVDGKYHWENINTYFLQMKKRDEEKTSKLPLLSASKDAEIVKEWQLPPKGGWDYAKVSGDYNGIHYISSYAKMMGFERDFIQPHRIVTNCINQLTQTFDSTPVRLDVAYKGPIYYKNKATMKMKSSKESCHFDIYSGDNDSPGICIDFRPVRAGSRLL